MKLLYTLLASLSLAASVAANQQLFQAQSKEVRTLVEAQFTYNEALMNLDDFADECNFIYYKSFNTPTCMLQLNDLFEKYGFDSAECVHEALYTHIKKLKKQAKVLHGKRNKLAQYKEFESVQEDIKELANKLIKTQATWVSVYGGRSILWTFARATFLDFCLTAVIVGSFSLFSLVCTGIYILFGHPYLLAPGIVFIYGWPIISGCALIGASVYVLYDAIRYQGYKEEYL